MEVKTTLQSHVSASAGEDRTKNLFIAATMMEHVGGVSHVRIGNPLAALAQEPGIAVLIVQNGVFPEPPPGSSGICILHRAVLSGDTGLALIRQLIAKDYTVVTEFDDNPDSFSVMQGEAMFSFRGVHAVQTSTAALADILRSKNPEVAVFPNTIPSLPRPANFRDPAQRTMFFGALNRTQDWAPFLPALNAAAASLGERLAFSIVHDRALFDALDTPHKSFVPTCDYETYLRLLGECEVSFMPLADTAFNRAKSDLKFIEAGACRVAALASTTVYGATIEDARTGLLFRTPAELLERLAWLAVNPMAEKLADAGRAWVAQHRMQPAQSASRIAWYRSLVARKAELTQALLARVPELAGGTAGPVPACQVRPAEDGVVRALAAAALEPLFWRPSRLGVPSGWYGHVPFAHWIVGAMRPATIVELGAHNGLSYSAFCDGVLRNRLPAKCFAVDTWLGDDHAGFYGEDVFADFSRFHDAHYAGFSKMLRCTFDAALASFPDGSIDLLHIDGRHGYDDVAHDFQSWRPKLSARAVVLFHDTAVASFGVGQLWAELRKLYPGFEFLHEHGLGVLAVGPDIAPEIASLVRSSDTAEAAALRDRFASIGERWRLEALARAQHAAIDALSAQLRLFRESAERHSAFPSAATRHPAAESYAA